MPAQTFSFRHPEKERLEHLPAIRRDLVRSDDALSSFLDRVALAGASAFWPRQSSHWP